MSRLSHQSRNTKATTTYATEPRVNNFRQVDRRSAVCLDCGAGIGEQCTSSTGRPTLHESRKRLTTRLHNEAMTGQWDALLEVNKISHKERRALRARAGVTHRELAERWGVSVSLVCRWFIDRQPPANDVGLAFAEWLLGERSKATS